LSVILQISNCVLKYVFMTVFVEELPHIAEGDMTFVPWIGEDAIQLRTAQIAGHLGAAFSGRHIRIIPVLRGGLEFSELLVHHLGQVEDGPASINVDPIHVKSYQGTESRELHWRRRPEFAASPVVHDVIVEDIADTARTLTAVEDCLRGEGPASLTSVVLLDRPDARAEGITYSPTVTGFHIQNPNAWAIGFGLDLDGDYRDLPLIYGKLGPDGELPPPYDIPALPPIVV